MTNRAGAAPAHLLMLRVWVPATARPDYDPWCDEHHRDLLRVPGVRRARRFGSEVRSTARRPDVLVTYELDDPSIIESDLWRAAGAASGPLPPTVAGSLRVERRLLRLAAALPDAWWPPKPSPRLDVFVLNDDRRMDGIVASMASVDVGAALPFTMRVLDDDTGPPLVLLDHHDEQGDDLLDALTGTSGANRSRWDVVFDESAIGAVDRP